MFTEDTVRTIREQSPLMERTGTITPSLLEVIYAHQLFKLFVPTALGGRMGSLPEALQWCEQASWADGSFGWLVTIGSGGGYFTPRMRPETARKLFTPREAVIAGSGFPSGVARREGGGYSVSGQWKYCSGATHATMFTANAMIDDNTMRSFILMPDQVRIVEDWQAFGLRATASHSIVVENAWVPEEMTFELNDVYDDYDDILYHYPFLPFAETSFAAVAIGIGRHFLEEARSVFLANKEAWKTSHPERYAFVLGKLDEWEPRLLQEVERFYDRVNQSWERHVRQGNVEEQEWLQVGQQSKVAANTALQAAQSIFPYMGIHAVMEQSAINRIYRDLHTACQHTMLVPFFD